jgi:hypothetical protein
MGVKAIPLHLPVKKKSIKMLPNSTADPAYLRVHASHVYAFNKEDK